MKLARSPKAIAKRIANKIRGNELIEVDIKVILIEELKTLTMMEELRKKGHPTQCLERTCLGYSYQVRFPTTKSISKKTAYAAVKAVYDELIKKGKK